MKEQLSVKQVTELISNRVDVVSRLNKPSGGQAFVFKVEEGNYTFQMTPCRAAVVVVVSVAII